MTQTWLYTFSWNEARMLPFFFRHYDPWIDRYVIFDDGSTDGTLEMLAARPNVEVRRFDRLVHSSFVCSATLVQNHIWKDVRGHATWVVVTAIDEHLHHPDIVGYLARCRALGISAIPALGFQMIADSFPADDTVWLAETLRHGAPFAHMNKLSIFDPARLVETNYYPGRHYAAPTGQVVYPATDELLNLHYKYVGRDYLQARNRLLASGLGPLDRQVGLGAQYEQTPDALEAEWRRFAAAAIDYRDPRVGAATHPERWWRSSQAA